MIKIILSIIAFSLPVTLTAETLIINKDVAVDGKMGIGALPTSAEIQVQAEDVSSFRETLFKGTVGTSSNSIGFANETGVDGQFSPVLFGNNEVNGNPSLSLQALSAPISDVWSENSAALAIRAYNYSGNLFNGGVYGDILNKKLFLVSNRYNTVFSIEADGRTGIGVGEPLEALDINGALRFGTTSSTNLGTLRYDNDTFQGYTTEGWVTLSYSNALTKENSGADQVVVVDSNGALTIAPDGDSENPVFSISETGVITMAKQGNISMGSFTATE